MMLGSDEDESPPKVFRADHPFTFTIVNSAGDVLFIGHVSQFR